MHVQVLLQVHGCLQQRSCPARGWAVPSAQLQHEQLSGRGPHGWHTKTFEFLVSRIRTASPAMSAGSSAAALASWSSFWTCLASLLGSLPVEPGRRQAGACAGRLGWQQAGASGSSAAHSQGCACGAGAQQLTVPSPRGQPTPHAGCREPAATPASGNALGRPAPEPPCVRAALRACASSWRSWNRRLCGSVAGVERVDAHSLQRAGVPRHKGEERLHGRPVARALQADGSACAWGRGRPVGRTRRGHGGCGEATAQPSKAGQGRTGCPRGGRPLRRSCTVQVRQAMPAPASAACAGRGSCSPCRPPAP